MQIVKDKVLYHINSQSSINPGELLNIGDMINTENKYNPFRNSYEIGIGSTGSYWRFAKELAIEQTRMQINRDLPSRWHCVWLSDEEELSYWKAKVHNQKYQIVKLKLNGKLFTGDAHWLEKQPCPLSEVREYAKHYWNGDFFRHSKKEYLFEGTAEVIEIVKSVNETE